MVKKIKIRKGTKIGVVHSGAGVSGIWVGNKRPEFFTTQKWLTSKGKKRITATVRYKNRTYARIGKRHTTSWSHLR